MKGTNATMCWCLFAFVAMKIPQAKTQKELMQLTSRELRRKLLESTPLNLPAAVLYALCFTLMPGAVLGAWLGMLSTTVLAGVAAYFWLWGEPAALDAFLWFWLVWALVDWVVIMLLRLVVGVRVFSRDKAFLAPDADAGVVELQPGGCMECELVENEERELVVQVPERGAYALTLKALDVDAPVKLSFDGDACLEESECVPGLVNTLHAVYRLEAGCHCLGVSLQGQPTGRVSISLR